MLYIIWNADILSLQKARPNVLIMLAKTLKLYFQMPLVKYTFAENGTTKQQTEGRVQT